VGGLPAWVAAGLPACACAHSLTRTTPTYFPRPFHPVCSIFTNVAVDPEGNPWWEGLTKNPPEDLINWRE
jgi:GTP-dependent phosphoenolpyruvate carboxykinase